MKKGRYGYKQGRMLPDSALRYVLEALVPYTEANLKLAFSPHRFFNDLDRICDNKYSRSSLSKAYYHARSTGLVDVNETGLSITNKGKQALSPYMPLRIHGACVLVVFDIPEVERAKRRYLRTLLYELKFTRLQQSVWKSDYDCVEILQKEIAEQSLEKCVEVFEAASV